MLMLNRVQEVVVRPPPRKSLVVKTRQRQTRKRYYHEVSSRKILMIQMVMIRSLTKAQGSILFTAMYSH